MRTSLRALSVGVASLGLALAATPASAVSSSSAPAQSTSYQISLQGSSVDISSLLSSGDLAKLLGASGVKPGTADIIAHIFGKRFEEKFGGLWSPRGPTTGSPAPAIPEPTAALAFGVGLVIATRRRR